jgi:hypothetical protein
VLVNEVLERELTREENLNMPDEVVTEVREFNETTGGSRTLTLAVTKAHCVVYDACNVAGPIEPSCPTTSDVTPAPMATVVPSQLFRFEDNEICCLRFLEYKLNARKTGKFRPGPKPHDGDCPTKLKQKQNL